MKILIAEDNVVSRTLLKATLRKWGYEVVSVTNGTEALTSLQCEDAPPLAILDVEMPGMDGTEVCKKLREMARPTPTYIILLTANADKAAAVAGLEAGADDYVTKPFDPGELRARVQVGARMVELQGSRAKYIKVLEDTFAQLERNSATLTQLNGKMLKEISERTRAEEELRLQKVLLESQSEASLDGVLVISAEGKIISVNHQFIEIWGLADEVLATKSGAAALQTIADNLDDPGEFLDLADWPWHPTDEKSDQELTLKDGRILHYYSAPARSSDGVYYGRASYFRDITERKRVEKEIRKSDERYRDLVENARDIIYSHDLEGNYTSTNRAGEEITGYTREETLQLNIADTVAPDYVEKARRMLTGKLAGEKESVYELEVIAKDGHRIAVEVNTRLVFQGNDPIGVQGIAREITERKQAEGVQARRAAQLALRGDINTALAESVPLRQILERSTEAIVKHLDAAFARIWTLSKDEDVLELQASAGIYTHIDGPHARVPVGAFKIGLIAKERQPHITNEVNSDPRVGDKEWAKREGMIAFAGYPLIVEDRLVGVIAMFARQKLADDTLDALASVADIISQGIERKRAEEELRESAERYRLLFENNPHPLWVYDLETLSFSAINEAAIQHYGYSREEFLSMTVKDIRPPEGVPALVEDISKLSGGINEAGIWRHRKKDGSIIDVEINSHELLFTGRRAKLVLANDVTERRKLEVQLRQAQKMESIGQLAAGIAHEINTPTQYVGDNLRFIQEAYQAQTQVMEEYGGLFAAAQLGTVSAELLDQVGRVLKEADLEYVAVEVPKALKQSLEGVERIAKIVQSMKDFAHPDAAEKKPVDLNRAIESTINVARGEWKYVAELETDFDLSLPLVPCLLGELNQMTLNLIINSSHAIAAKMKTAEQGMGVIKITTRREEDWAVIRISDTGLGIPLAIRSRVFDPFFTTKEVGKGTGQGLAISHTVVEKHGGTITFETAEGEGTTFIIRLPLYEIAKTPGGLKEAA